MNGADGRAGMYGGAGGGASFLLTGRTMKRATTHALIAILAGIGGCTGTAAPGAPGGPIDRLPLGEYVCEMPGDATGPAGIHLPEQSFSVLNASTYATPQGRGTYLLTGNLLVMTSGPKRGQRFHRLSQNFLREIGRNGADGPMRCVRQVTNNR